MKKKAIIISIPFIVIAAVVVYFFVRYSSVERSIYLKNLKYRFDWKLSGARESTYDEQKSFETIIILYSKKAAEQKLILMIFLKYVKRVFLLYLITVSKE